MKASPGQVTVGCRWLVALLVATLAMFVSAESASATASGWGPDASFTANIGTGFNNTVAQVVRQSDGKFVVGGNFTSFNGVTRNRLARLNADGTPDTAFNANLGTGFDANVVGVTVQPDGKILVGGNFTNFNGVALNRLVRLNSDGTRDTAFSTALGSGFGPNVARTVVQPDGKILVAGLFSTFNGVAVNRLVRLNSDGTRDTAFSTALGAGFNNAITPLLVQPDGKILAGGAFTAVNGTTTGALARLNASGTLDTAFAANLGIRLRPRGGLGHRRAIGRTNPRRRQLHRSSTASPCHGWFVSTPTAPRTLRSTPRWGRGPIRRSWHWRCRRTGRSSPAAR